MENTTTNPPKLILRDYLAIDRSKLANERTLLAYARTGLMFFVSGISLVKLFSTDLFLVYLGYILIPISIFIVILGLIRFKHTHTTIAELYQKR
ncbi:DUF202 domain-containing protein [Ancylomarina longa]|uniref:DUF202 domain-containing protein n=1 Tax=Ancylomarina longa TaxID=2487017 RepID=A0A434AXL8_9BACT|nr:DUF202 domain-containing protein [Ancylomarina longa]RUT79160.1 DUF202 domain-containing protein [Ancylomarina longa]